MNKCMGLIVINFSNCREDAEGVCKLLKPQQAIVPSVLQHRLPQISPPDSASSASVTTSPNKSSEKGENG